MAEIIFYDLKSKGGSISIERGSVSVKYPAKPYHKPYPSQDDRSLGAGSNSLANQCLLYRIEHNLTMTQLAQRIGVSSRTIERIENNEKLVSEKIQEKVSHYLFNLV